MEMSEKRKLEPYFYNDYLMDGKYDLPLVVKQAIDVDELKLIRFSSIVKNETRDTDATVHFFEFDDKFDEIWRNPPGYFDELKQYKQVITPDFSIYTNMSISLQIFNTFRTRWCGAYWQRKGLTAIPSVSWSDEYSYDFSFGGIEKGSIVAVSTIGCSEAKKLFLAGYVRMCDVVKPQKVICYAKPFDEMKEYADLIEVPYRRNERVAPSIVKGEK